MKIKVTLTVDIDPEAWVANYGCEKSEVREDVKVYIAETVSGQLDLVGVLNKEDGS